MKIKINSLALMMILSSKSEALHKNQIQETQTVYLISKKQPNSTNQMTVEQLKNILYNAQILNKTTQTTQTTQKQATKKKSSMNKPKFSIKKYKKNRAQKTKNKNARLKVRLKDKEDKNKRMHKLIVDNQLQSAKHNKILLKNDIKNIQKQHIAKINAIKKLNKATNKIQNNQCKNQNKTIMNDQINVITKNAAKNINAL